MRRVFGVDLVIDAVARQLAARGHAVTVYASVIKATDGRPYRLVRTPTRASRIPHRYEAAARYWAGFIDEGEHDVVFIESYPFFSLIPRLRTPAIAVDHGVASTVGMALVQRLAFGYIARAAAPLLPAGGGDRHGFRLPPDAPPRAAGGARACDLQRRRPLSGCAPR